MVFLLSILPFLLSYFFVQIILKTVDPLPSYIQETMHVRPPSLFLATNSEKLPVWADVPFCFVALKGPAAPFIAKNILEI
jgi:hypothetical protein